jgi:hypothetical protein
MPDSATLRAVAAVLIAAVLVGAYMIFLSQMNDCGKTVVSLSPAVSPVLLQTPREAVAEAIALQASLLSPPPAAAANAAKNMTLARANAEVHVVRQSDRASDALSWAISGEAEKRGGGILLFAYGGKQLPHFLREAAAAAASFRRDNPKLPIAIVTNNESVNRHLFDIHLKPRADLLFAGDLTNGGQNRKDKLPRQWLTRLYYMAHSPFEVTWALDSNVVSCTAGAAQAFVDEALRTKLWGYDIAHASQSFGSMYPHNWNLVYRWSATTSSLMRDWLLLQLRRGVTYDDQKTLHIAELRHQAAGRLGVGQLRSNYAAAFYNVNAKRKDGARITRRIDGRAHMVHGTDKGACEWFNGGRRDSPGSAKPAPRQMVTMRAPCKPGQTSGCLSKHAVYSKAECAALLKPGRPPEQRRGGSCPGHAVEPMGAVSMQPGAALSRFVDQAAVYPPRMETLEHFVQSGRAGTDI